MVTHLEIEKHYSDASAACKKSFSRGKTFYSRNISGVISNFKKKKFFPPLKKGFEVKSYDIFKFTRKEV